MSGNKTYIGPFGRILPLPEDHDEEPEEVLGPADETRSSFAMYTLPRPALDFGSDSRGFTDPLRYRSQRNETQPAKRRAIHDMSGDQVRAAHKPLPGVRQLLEPAVQSANTPPMPLPPQGPSEQSSSCPGQTRVPELVSHTTSQPHSTKPRSPPSLENPHFLPHSPAQDYRSTDCLTSSSEAAAQGYVQNPPQISPSFPAYPVHTTRNFYLPLDNTQQGLSAGYPPSSKPPHDISNGYLDKQVGFHQTAYVMPHQQDSTKVNVTGDNVRHPTQLERSPENSVKLHPRVVREALLPGEGPVWVFADGTTCPKVIDGEPVNAEWGVTKAGKPRKRLAIACTTCREKKIKCQPALPKCAQCDKYGRECHYATAPRNLHSVSKTSSYDSQARYKPVKIKAESQNYKVLLPLITVLSEENCKHTDERTKSSSEEKVAPPSLECTLQNKLEKLVSNNQGSHIPSITSERGTGSNPIRKRSNETNFAIDKSSWEEHLSRIQSVKYDWGTNPYSIDPTATKHYAKMFLLHGNAAAQYLFPRKGIIRWLESSPDGSRNDMMLIYAILALGSVFSRRQHCKLDGELFAEVARHAIEESQSSCSLQLVQSRLLLGLYFFANGDSHLGWNFSGQGIRSTHGLKLNLEKRYRSISEDEEDHLGLRHHALVECRRRTYWLAYVIDRLGDFCEDHVPMLQSQDTFLRLPCTDINYSLQGPSNAPYFRRDYQHTNTGQKYQNSALGPMAFLVEISSIWGDISSYIYRHSRDSVARDALQYTGHHRVTSTNLSEWKANLNKDMICTHSNISLNIEKGTISMFLELHTLYHAAQMRLHRNLFHNTLPPALQHSSIVEARNQAHQLLEIMSAVSSASRSYKNPLDTSATFPDFSSDRNLESHSPLAGSTPSAGHAILIAIDILSAGGGTDPAFLDPLIECMTAGLATVDELAQCWASAAAQKKVILQRLECLARIKTRSVAAGDTKQFWRFRRPLNGGFSSGLDIFYAGVEGAVVDDCFWKGMGLVADEWEVLFLD